MTCSRTLAIPSMFRDAYIWTSRNETSMANAMENYFDLHPDPTLACVTCTDRRCACPQGIDIPAALGRIHERMHALEAAGLHPGPSAGFAGKTVGEALLVQSADAPSRLAPGEPGVARFQVRNVSESTVARAAARPRVRGLRHRRRRRRPSRRDRAAAQHRLPGEVSPLAFEFAGPPGVGRHTVGFRLMPMLATGPADGLLIHTGGLFVEAASDYAARLVEHTFPAHASAGVTYGVRLLLSNGGRLPWRGHDPADRVEVHVSVDGVLQAPLTLPRAEVAPGEDVTLHFPYRVHDAAGPHTVSVELIRRTPAGFSGAGDLRGLSRWR